MGSGKYVLMNGELKPLNFAINEGKNSSIMEGDC